MDIYWEKQETYVENILLMHILDVQIETSKFNEYCNEYNKYT